MGTSGKIVLDISVSNRFDKEKEYIISVLITDILGLEYNIHYSKKDEYKIAFNDKSLIFDDYFFSRVSGDNLVSYENLPQKILNSSICDHHISIFYGNDSLIRNSNEINLGFDLFGSAFFMLTRWEEIIANKDEHQRVKTEELVSYQHNLHRKPIVNEWIELLWALLKDIGVPDTSRTKREFEIKFTHDVDHPLLFANHKAFFKQTTYQLRTGNILQALKFSKRYLSDISDPYNTFDHLMDISEKNGVKSQFNFMCSQSSKYDEGYDVTYPSYKGIVENIKQRGHGFGFHPSYETYKNSTLWKSEKSKLEGQLGLQLSSGRQHYLRFNIPATWRIWENNEMKEDSTIGFSDEVGFRAGICYSYHPFDMEKRSKLKLLETPLILMEGALIDRLKATPKEFLNISNELKQEVKKYNGTYSVLWHNSTFFIGNYDKYKYLLTRV